jgi:hypothetical protein
LLAGAEEGGKMGEVSAAGCWELCSRMMPGRR